MIPYKITAELNLKKIIAESKEVAQALNEFADNLERIEKKHANPQQSKMTNSDILKIFNEKYPGLKNIDYRPLCPEMFTKDLYGITIWLDNGDVIQYYPKEAQESEG